MTISVFHFCIFKIFHSFFFKLKLKLASCRIWTDDFLHTKQNLCLTELRRHLILRISYNLLSCLANKKIFNKSINLKTRLFRYFLFFFIFLFEDFYNLFPAFYFFCKKQFLYLFPFRQQRTAKAYETLLLSLHLLPLLS